MGPCLPIFGWWWIQMNISCHRDMERNITSWRQGVGDHQILEVRLREAIVVQEGTWTNEGWWHHQEIRQLFSLLYMVRMSDDASRPCRDYYPLNLATRTDKYPVPNITDLAAPLQSFHQAGPLERLLSNTSPSWSQPQNSSNHYFRPGGVPAHALWPLQCWAKFQRLMNKVGACLIFVYLLGRHPH